ncbi:uncharacterized protein [Nicotiana tomentosiformis]|uniref:uncharacterized protein n=1 Tax=Nicotiana tomentosiformis TaxID=4098 RepID=UPI00388CA305
MVNDNEMKETQLQAGEGSCRSKEDVRNDNDKKEIVIFESPGVVEKNTTKIFNQEINIQKNHNKTKKMKNQEVLYHVQADEVMEEKRDLPALQQRTTIRFNRKKKKKTKRKSMPKKRVKEYISPQNFIASSVQGSQQNKENDVSTNKSNNKVENGMEKNNGDKVRTESMSSNNTDHIHNIDEDKVNDQNSSTNKEYQDKRQDDLNKYRISTSLSSRVKNEQAIQLVVELFGDQ